MQTYSTSFNMLNICLQCKGDHLLIYLLEAYLFNPKFSESKIPLFAIPSLDEACMDID